MPTAAYCLDPKSSRPLGEQRRRARYDAKKKAALLSESFKANKFSLLELGKNVTNCFDVYLYLRFLYATFNISYNVNFHYQNSDNSFFYLLYVCM